MEEKYYRILSDIKHVIVELEARVYRLKKFMEVNRESLKDTYSNSEHHLDSLMEILRERWDEINLLIEK